MVRVLLILCVVLLTGCGHDEKLFVKSCVNEVNSGEVMATEEKEVTYNDNDEITKVIVTRSYKGDEETISGIKEAAIDYNNNLSSSKDIEVKIVEDNLEGFSVSYTLNVLKLSSEELELFELQTNSIKYFNKMKSEGITCE